MSKKLTEAQQKILDDSRDFPVHLQFVEGKGPEYTQRRRKLPSRTVEELIRRGYLVGAGDQLFGHFSQTYSTK